MRAKNTHRSVKTGRQTLVFILVLLRKSCLKSLLQKEPCHYKSPVSSRSGGGMLYHWVNTQSRKEHVISLQPKRQHDRTPVCANKNQTPERIRNQIIYYTQNVPDSGFLITCFHYYKNIYSYAKRKTRYPLPTPPSPNERRGWTFLSEEGRIVNRGKRGDNTSIEIYLCTFFWVVRIMAEFIIGTNKSLVSIRSVSRIGVDCC